MPIKDRSLYPANWREISQRIREREEQKCKWCKAPNRTVIVRGDGQFAGTYATIDGEFYDDKTGEHRGIVRGSDYVHRSVIEVVLTVAHLDHNPANNDDENLAALCQQCHLRYDAKHHARTAAQTRLLKRRQREPELF